MIADLPRLHAVTDDRVVAGPTLVSRAAAMAEAAGPALAVHLRTRVLEGRALLLLARELYDAITPHGSWLAVNGRPDVARAAKARLFVSGRGGLATADVRRVAPSVLVMRSVHDESEIQRAIAEGADALLASTGTDYGRQSAIGNRQSQTDLPPVIAIGGITPANAREWLDRGAFGVAAIRALWDAPDPAAAARAFLGILPSDRRLSVVINGEKRTAREGTLAGLLADLGLDARAVVVEHNRHIVRRDALAATSVGDGDTIELVQFVGGG